MDNNTLKLINHPLFQAFVVDKGIRLYNKTITGRLGMPGLKKLVLEKTGHEIKIDEAYVFLVRNQDVVKILVRDEETTSVMEFHESAGRDMKEIIRELGLM